jgi:DNA invertase Pin-like site-specific DNA recombinase
MANRKLTEKQVIEIKQLLNEGKVKTFYICEKYNCSRQTVWNIKNKGYYKHLDKYVACSEEELFHHEKLK